MWIKIEIVENGYILKMMVGAYTHKQWVVLDRSDIPDAIKEIERYTREHKEEKEADNGIV